MSRGQTNSNSQRNGRPSSVLKSLADEGKRTRGIERKEVLEPVRRSTRLQEIQRKNAGRRHLLPPSASNSKFQQHSPALKKASDLNRNGKRSQEAGPPQVRNEPAGKGAQTSLERYTVEDKEAVSNTYNQKSGPVRHWVQEGSWPKEYFEQGINMSLPLAQKKSPIALRREEFEASSVVSSQNRDGKSAPYKDPAYEFILREKGSYLDESSEGITDDSQISCRALLINTAHTIPQDSLFRDDLFQKACRKLRARNKARVINDISRLIVPCPENLATYGAIHLDCLISGMNERWNESIPVTETHPQPDFCVGFTQAAFTRDQLKKLHPFTGNVLAATRLCSLFLASCRIFFPFFTCEAKCRTGELDIADHQNAHSMTLAVRGIVELFKLGKRENELHRKILAFSISHDDRTVRIYGHYPMIDGDNTTFYRHPIHDFSFTALGGEEKWTAYKFTKSIYDVWMPVHFQLICSAIDDIPVNLNFGSSLGDPSTSLARANEAEPPDSQEMATVAPASRDGEFQVPKLPPA